jgi:delta8-fatty-acid desaturase
MQKRLQPATELGTKSKKGTVVKNHSFESPFENVYERVPDKAETLSACCPRSTPGSIAVFVAGVSVTLRVALMMQDHLGYRSPERDTSSMELFSLALLAGFIMLLVPGVLVRIKATRRLGFIIYHRIADFKKIKENWANETLRSFVELGVWLGVCFCTYGMTNSPTMSVLFASIAGCFVAVVGDYSAPYLNFVDNVLRRAGERACDGDRSASSSLWWVEDLDGHEDELARVRKSVPITLLMLYGYSGVSMTYSLCNDLLTAALVCASAGILLLSCARIFSQVSMTKRLGRAIQDRILCTVDNWTTHPMRSALESMSWTGVTLGAYSVFGDLLVAVQAGTFSGIVIAIFGELNTLGTDDGAQEEPKEVRLVPLCIFGYAGLASSYGLFHYSHNGYTACLMTASASAGFLLAGRLFMFWQPTRKAGTLLQGRFTDCVANWEVYTFRSIYESVMWAVSFWGSFVYTNSMLMAVPIGSFGGVFCILLNEWMGIGANASSTSIIERVSSEQEIHQMDRVDTLQVIPAVASAATKPALPSPSSSHYLASVTLEKLACHNTADDAWISIHGLVYNVTHWAPRHPGGEAIVLKYAGLECGDQFEAFHNQHTGTAKKYMKSYLVGKMVETRSTTKNGATEDYRLLREKLWKEGYFVADHSYFFMKHLVWIALVAAGVSTLVWRKVLVFESEGNLGMIALSAVLVGIGLQQAAFLAHDALHNGISSAARGGGVNVYGAVMGSAVFGISSAMWLEEHNLHHAITLRPREDPQHDMLPFFMHTLKELEGPNAFQMGYVSKFLVSIQHWTLVPMALVIGRVNLVLNSFCYAVRHCVSSKHARLDVLFMTFHCSAYLILNYCYLETYFQMLIFGLFLSLAVGILHIQLLLSHLATETFTREEEQNIGFFEFQLRTSRNITCKFYEHWFFGGLEYQIEHHLFPMLPRHHLKDVKPMVEEICQKHGIKYRSIRPIRALLECLADFKEIAHEVVCPPDICVPLSASTKLSNNERADPHHRDQ